MVFSKELQTRLIKNTQHSPGQGHTEDIAQQSQEESADLAVQTHGSEGLKEAMLFSKRQRGTMSLSYRLQQTMMTLTLGPTAGLPLLSWKPLAGYSTTGCQWMDPGLSHLGLKKAGKVNLDLPASECLSFLSLSLASQSHTRHLILSTQLPPIAQAGTIISISHQSYGTASLPPPASGPSRLY